MTRREQRIGALGQEQAARALRMVGVEMVEKIATPVKLIASQHKGYFRVVYGEVVSGDHRGILPDGTSVLAETKTVLDGNLTWSHLRDHQPRRLTEHAEYGGVSLLVWVHGSGIYVMKWPVPGFMPGKSIKPDQADKLHIYSLLPKSRRLSDEQG